MYFLVVVAIFYWNVMKDSLAMHMFLAYGHCLMISTHECACITYLNPAPPCEGSDFGPPY